MSAMPIDQNSSPALQRLKGLINPALNIATLGGYGAFQQGRQEAQALRQMRQLIGQGDMAGAQQFYEASPLANPVEVLQSRQQSQAAENERYRREAFGEIQWLMQNVRPEARAQVVQRMSSPEELQRASQMLGIDLMNPDSFSDDVLGGIVAGQASQYGKAEDLYASNQPARLNEQEALVRRAGGQDQFTLNPNAARNRGVDVMNAQTARMNALRPPSQQEAAQGVQSKFTDENGQVVLIMRDGSLRQTQMNERNPFQVVNIGDTPTGVNRITGEAIPLQGQGGAVTSDTVGKNRANIENIQAAEQGRREAAAGLPMKETNVGLAMANIARLKPGGELHDAFRAAYGFRRPDMMVVPGEERRNAEAVVKQIAGEQTLEAAESLKGVLSDKDMMLLRERATRLNNQDITDTEALKALNEIEGIMARGLEIQRRKASNGRQNPTRNDVDDLLLKYEVQ